MSAHTDLLNKKRAVKIMHDWQWKLLNRAAACEDGLAYDDAMRCYRQRCDRISDLMRQIKDLQVALDDVPLTTSL